MNEHEFFIQQPPKFDPKTFLSKKQGQEFLRLTKNTNEALRQEDTFAALRRIAEGAINYREAQLKLNNLNNLINQTDAVKMNAKQVLKMLFGRERIRPNIYSIDQIDKLEERRRKIENNMQDILKNIADILRSIGIYNDDEARPRNPKEEQLTNILGFNPDYIKRIINVFNEYFLNQESQESKK